MTPRRTEPAARLPADLAGPVDLALARSVETIPAEAALPGGSRYEPKWDGFRASILRRGDTARIWSRQRKDLTDRFPDIAAAAARILPDGCVLDGVI
jgi:ATP-dependent DNA ligase